MTKMYMHAYVRQRDCCSQPSSMRDYKLEAAGLRLANTERSSQHSLMLSSSIFLIGHMKMASLLMALLQRPS